MDPGCHSWKICNSCWERWIQTAIPEISLNFWWKRWIKAAIPEKSVIPAGKDGTRLQTGIWDFPNPFIDAPKPWIYPRNLNSFIPAPVLAKLELIFLPGADPVGNWLGMPWKTSSIFGWKSVLPGRKRGVENPCWNLVFTHFSHPVQFPHSPFKGFLPFLKINRIWGRGFAAGSVAPEAAAPCLEFRDFVCSWFNWMVPRLEVKILIQLMFQWQTFPIMSWSQPLNFAPELFVGLTDEKDEAQRPNSSQNLRFNPKYFPLNQRLLARSRVHFN